MVVKKKTTTTTGRMSKMRRRMEEVARWSPVIRVVSTTTRLRQRLSKIVVD
jgi:hypothetical protein